MDGKPESQNNRKAGAMQSQNDRKAERPEKSE
jgi:hypothetical protein